MLAGASALQLAAGRNALSANRAAIVSAAIPAPHVLSLSESVDLEVNVHGQGGAITVRTRQGSAGDRATPFSTHLTATAAKVTVSGWNGAPQASKAGRALPRTLCKNLTPQPRGTILGSALVSARAQSLSSRPRLARCSPGICCLSMRCRRFTPLGLCTAGVWWEPRQACGSHLASSTGLRAPVRAAS